MIIIGVLAYIIFGWFISWRIVRHACLGRGQEYYDTEEVCFIAIGGILWPLSLLMNLAAFKIKIK